MPKGPSSGWAVKTTDQELKAIVAIQKALEPLDTQSAGRVLTFCIDRARPDFERVGFNHAQTKTRNVKEVLPLVESPHSELPLPEPAALQPV